MNPTDKELMEWYWRGWKDKSELDYDSTIFEKAYHLGRLDFKAGDDLSIVDKQTEEEILKRIKS